MSRVFWPTTLFAAIFVTAAALWYVTAPPKGVDGYRERAASTAETLVSQLETARLWAQSEEEGKALRTSVLVGFEETEEDAEAAASAFESYEPPDGVADLREELTSLAAEATEALAALRIAAQQERWEDVPELSRPLPELSEKLSALEEGAEP
ncbi:MAG TPA: hypothetical protein VFY69_09795 [Solirubrobacterales bacterium]|nr:hypothetical protein [Solirubrobacterales bacterium]